MTAWTDRSAELPEEKQLAVYLANALGFTKQGLKPDDISVRMAGSAGDKTEITLSYVAAEPRRENQYKLVNVIARLTKSVIAQQGHTTAGGVTFTVDYSLDELAEGMKGTSR